MREQGEKEEAERLLDQVSKGVRAGAHAKQRAETKRALSARARERQAVQQQAERCVTMPSALLPHALALLTNFPPSHFCHRAQAMREAEAAAARAVASAHDRERVQFRDAEFQQKRARAAAAVQEEEEEQRRRAAVLHALACSVAPTVEADPRRVLQVFGFCCRDFD